MGKLCGPLATSVAGASHSSSLPTPGQR